MMDASQMDVPAHPTSLDPTILSLTLPTAVPLVEFSGRQTAAHFGPLEQEMRALLNGCGVFDLGWRARIAVRGEDRLRWLSGMVTNSVQQLAEGEGNYSFFLNAQGRIQGDAFVYRDGNQLWLDTTFDQVKPLLTHLDHFIIMDDVSLEEEHSFALGIAGPQAVGMLAAVGLAIAETGENKNIQVHKRSFLGVDLSIVSHPGVLTPQYEVFCPAEHAVTVWQRLLDAGARPCGVEAVEGLRILEGLPRYGVDILDRDLPQETGQTRALNFNKGCYLGQEIVERIRSRGAVHRELRQFSLQGDRPTLPVDLMAEGKVIGRVTSAVSLALGSGTVQYALGIARGDALNQTPRLTYNGGVVTALDRVPAASLL